MNPASPISITEKKDWSTGSLGPRKTDPPSILPWLPDVIPHEGPLSVAVLAPGMRVRLNSPVLAVAHLEIHAVEHKQNMVTGFHQEVGSVVTVPAEWCGGNE